MSVSIGLSRKRRADWLVCGWSAVGLGLACVGAGRRPASCGLGREARGGVIAYQVGGLAFDDELLLLEVLYENERRWSA